MRRSVEIKLTEADRSELERLARGRRVWRSLSDRAHIVLLAAEGLTNVQIANTLGINSHTARKWRNRFAEQRMDGLEDETRSGRPRCIDDDAVAEVIRKTLEETPRDATHWSTRSMARATGYAPSTIHRMWQAFSLQPHRSETFKLSADPYFVDIDRCKPSTQKAVRWVLNAQLLPTFGSLPLDRITRAGVIRWFDEYSRTAPGGANHALNLLCRILNHAVECGHLQTNPARSVKRNPRPKLTRFLSREEISRLHRVLDRYGRARPSRAQQADVIRLLLLTGCRRSEILTLRWQNVDGDTLKLADAKTGPRRVFLNAPARGILQRQPRSGSAYVFPSLLFGVVV